MSDRGQLRHAQPAADLVFFVHPCGTGEPAAGPVDRDQQPWIARPARAGAWSSREQRGTMLFGDELFRPPAQPTLGLIVTGRCARGQQVTHCRMTPHQPVGVEAVPGAKPGGGTMTKLLNGLLIPLPLESGCGSGKKFCGVPAPL